MHEETSESGSASGPPRPDSGADSGGRRHHEGPESLAEPPRLLNAGTIPPRPKTSLVCHIVGNAWRCPDPANARQRTRRPPLWHRAEDGAREREALRRAGCRGGRPTAHVLCRRGAGDARRHQEPDRQWRRTRGPSGGLGPQLRRVDLRRPGRAGGAGLAGAAQHPPEG